MHCSWKCKLSGATMESSIGSSQKLNIELLHDPAISLLSYLEEMKTLIREVICISTFICSIIYNN